MLRSEKLRWLGLDMRPRWRRRIAVIVSYCVLFAATRAYDGRWGHTFLAMILLSSFVMAVGIFSPAGPGKPLAEPQERIVIEGLDQWAMYYYAVPNFDAATPEQQASLLRRYREGMYVVPAKPWLDEREMKERDQLERWTMQCVITALALETVWYGVGDRVPTSMEVAGTLWGIMLLAKTLSQARILWTEPDPREISDELELVIT